MRYPGKELARLRKEKGLTLKTLAELAGTKPKYIGDLEHGKPSGIEVASKLAKALDVPLEIFWIKSKQKHYTDTLAVEDIKNIGNKFTQSLKLKILDLSPRSLNALYRANIKTVGELLLLSEKDLAKIRGLGPASQLEVKLKLAKYSPPRTDATPKTGNIYNTDSVDN